MMKIMRKTVSASLLVLGLSLSAGVASAEELPLEEAVERGMMTNPEYGVVANNRRATDAELRQAQGLYLPSLDAAANVGVEWTEDQADRAFGQDGGSLGTYDYSLTLTQMLFDGFAARSEVERQRARVRSAAHRVAETAEFVGLGVTESYLEVMRQRDLLAIARDNVQQHMAMMNEIRTSEMAGQATEADIAQADARLAAARANEANVLERLATAESQFIREVGEAADILVMPALPVDMVSDNVDEAIRVALTESPTLDIFEADMDVARAEYEATGANFYPQFDLRLTGRQREDDAGVQGLRKEAAAEVVMNWNLYRGGIDTALRREHVYRHAQTKESRAEAVREVEDDVRVSWAAMVAAGTRAEQYAEQALANERVVAAYKDQFQLGRRTLLDVLDSQNELFVSRSNAVNSEYLEMLAVYRLLALQGRLLASLGVQRPGESSLADMN